MNLNDVAIRIAKRESGKQEVSIGQIKEILKLTCEEFAEADTKDLLRTIARYRQ